MIDADYSITSADVAALGESNLSAPLPVPEPLAGFQAVVALVLLWRMRGRRSGC